MKAQIKSIISPDVLDFENFLPKDPESFSFLLQLLIGPADTEGEESFSLQVCTPKWLLSRMGQQDVLFGRHMLIVKEYNIARIISKLSVYLEACIADNWDQIAEKIARIGAWEFEDYKDC